MTLNWADGFVIVVIAISAFLEYKRGFLLSVFKTASFVISMFLAWLVNPFVSEFLQKSFVYTWIHDSVTQSVMKEDLAGQMVDKAQQSTIIDNLQIPDFFKTMLKSSEAIKNSDIIKFDDLKKQIVDFMANTLTGILSIIVVFIVVMVLIRVLSGTLEIISKIPILKEVNQLFGIVLGVIIGLIEVWLSYMAIIFLFGTNTGFAFVFHEINTSTIAKFLYENNLINYILAGMFK